MKRLIRVNAKDVESGMIRAYIVQKQEVTRRPTRRVRKMLSRRKRIRDIGYALATVVKGAYVASVILAMTTAMSLLEAGNIVDIGRLVACLIWVAVPVSCVVVRNLTK